MAAGLWVRRRGISTITASLPVGGGDRGEGLGRDHSASVFVCVGIRQPKCVSSNRLYVCACVGVCVSVCAYVLSSTVF